MPAQDSARSALPDQFDATEVAQVRDLFWQNVMREILTSLSVMSMNAPRAPAPQSLPAAAGKAPETPQQQPQGENPFDGRFGILTQGGERIAIARVYPLFACGVNNAPGAKSLSMAVECTVFQIHTPDGHVFTLPLHEMRGFHALTPELMARLEATARDQAHRLGDAGEENVPFGFAAFTSLSQEAGRGGSA